ncbi:flagellar biosynthetic protein FliO [Brevundimonas sp. PWP3-1b1]|uniref:flagellar biosynthetic protein FliO n=1 Tax=unclassified Brevundimonas TaxID=2622653 RepID=UPI003CF74112
MARFLSSDECGIAFSREIASAYYTGGEFQSCPEAGASVIRRGSLANLQILGPRERATVVIWRDEVLLLGVTAGGVTVLDRRTRTPEEIAEDAARVEAAQAQTAAMPKRLKALLGKSLAGERPDYRR